MSHCVPYKDMVSFYKCLSTYIEDIWKRVHTIRSSRGYFLFQCQLVSTLYNRT